MTFFFLQVFKFPPLSLSTSRPLSLSLSALSLSLRSLSLSLFPLHKNSTPPSRFINSGEAAFIYYC